MLAGQSSRYGSKKGKIVLKGPPVVLVRTENAWKPVSLEKSSNVDDMAALLMKAQGILNKIAPEKFDSLSDQLIDVAKKIDETHLPQLANKLFNQVGLCCLKRSSLSWLDWNCCFPCELFIE